MARTISFLVVAILHLQLVFGETSFFERFDENWESRWNLQGPDTLWGHEMGKFGETEAEKGLRTMQDMSAYLATSRIEKPFALDPEKSLFIQFSVKYEKRVDCGGGYIKIGPVMEDLSTFDKHSEYYIMFGPDKCGATERTHLIFNYKGRNVLKTEDLPYKQESVGVTHLYTLEIAPKNKIVVYVDDSEIYSGDLVTDWDLLPPKEIEDKEDKKPEDWVDEKKIIDPSPDNVKPDDWVEEKTIPDLQAKKPEEWDEEEDGEWEAPTVPNPDYKGEWRPKKIANPDYKGEWKPKMIPNPDYTDDDSEPLKHYTAFGYVAIELWQVKSGTIFDNIIISHDEEDVEEVQQEFLKIQKREKAKLAEEERKQSEQMEAAAEAGRQAESRDDDEDFDDFDDDEKEEL